MKGITKACPACRKIILRYCNFKGEGSFETRCPHCDELVVVKLEMEPCIKICRASIAIIVIVLAILFTIPVIGIVISTVKGVIALTQ